LSELINKFIINKTFQFIILFLCFAYIAWFFWEHRAEIVLTLELGYFLIFFIAAICVLYLIVYGLRFKLVIEKSSRSNLPYIEWLKCFILGRFFNQFFPQFGNIYRSFHLKNFFGVSHTLYISSFFSFVWMDTVLNFALTLTALAILDFQMMLFDVNGITLISFLLLITICVPFVFHRFFRLLQFKNKSLEWISLKLKEVFEVTLTNIKQIKFVLFFIVLGVMGFFLVILTYHFIFLGIGVSVQLSQLVLFYTLHKLGASINITPSNIGIRELAYGILCSDMGYGMATGIVASAILRIFNFTILVILGAFMGGISIAKRRKEYDDLKF
jgi:hypothetical protein